MSLPGCLISTYPLENFDQTNPFKKSKFSVKNETLNAADHRWITFSIRIVIGNEEYEMTGVKGTWYHFIFQYDGQSVTIFINLKV